MTFWEFLDNNIDGLIIGAMLLGAGVLLPALIILFGR